MKTNLTQDSETRFLHGHLVLALLFVLSVLTGRAAPFGTEFTYQGRLDGTNGTANGRYDFTFGLHLAASGGTAIVTVTNGNVGVSNGLFTTAVDFGGGIYNGNAYWIQLGVRTNGSGTFTALSPRQPLTPTPNAQFAALAGTVPGGSISSTKLAVDSVTTSALQNNAVTGAKIANGQVVRNLNGLQDAVILAAGTNTTLVTNGNTLTLSGSGDWKLGGNAGTTAANFIGTADNQPLAVKVNGATALRIDPTVTAPNIIGGLQAFRPTVIGSNVRGAVVAGGAAPAGPVNGFGGGDFHAVWDSDGTIGGGFGNKIGTDNNDPDDSPFATVAGGVFNSAAGYAATVAGGDGNFAGGVRSAVVGGAGNQATGEHTFVGAGIANQAQSAYSTIGGGQNNIATNAHSAVAGGGWNTASGISSFIGGGGGDTFGGPWPNTASGNWSAILGGWNNTASGYSSAIGGGAGNTASGIYATIPGGNANQASGNYSFAAGYGAQAAHPGAFVWSDGSGGGFSSSGPNQFCVRAAGGVLLSDNLAYGGQLNKLDVADNFTATVRAADFLLGFSGRRGSPGRALVDLTDTLYLNFASDWAHTFIGGDNVSVCSLTVRGGCDIAEPFQMSRSEKEIPKGAVVVIDEDNPGHLKMSDRACDRRVAGIVSGANGVNTGVKLTQEGVFENGQNVALSGRVYVQADAGNGSIVPGDLLTTSDVPGHAMKVIDPAKAQGAILGKAMTGLKAGQGFVLVLVTLQ
jgi:hypothetical protein